MASGPPPTPDSYASGAGHFPGGFPPEEFSSGPAYSPGRRRAGCRGCLFVTCGCLVGAVVAGTVAVIVISAAFGPQIQEYFWKRAQDSPAYQHGVQRVTSSQRIKERLGEGIHANQPTRFNYQVTPAGRYAMVQFQITGEKGRGIVTSTAIERHGNWELQQLWIAYEDGTGEDLLKTEPR